MRCCREEECIFRDITNSDVVRDYIPSLRSLRNIFEREQRRDSKLVIGEKRVVGLSRLDPPLSPLLHISALSLCAVDIRSDT